MRIVRFLVAALAAPAALYAQEGIATFKYTVHAQSTAQKEEYHVFF